MKISKISESISAVWNQKFPLHEGWQTLIERESLGDSVLVEGRLLRDGTLMSNAAAVWDQSVPYAELEDQVRLRLYANCGVVESDSVATAVVVAAHSCNQAVTTEVVVEEVVTPEAPVEQDARSQVKSSDLFAGSLPFARAEDVATAPMLDLGTVAEEVAVSAEVVVETPVDDVPVVESDSDAESRKKRERALDSEPANATLIRAGNLSRRNRGLPPLAEGATKEQARAAIRGEDN